jgi:hypothetical protein
MASNQRLVLGAADVRGGKTEIEIVREAKAAGGTLTRSSLRARSESRVPTRRSGTLNCADGGYGEATRELNSGGRVRGRGVGKGDLLRGRAECRRSGGRWSPGGETTGSLRWRQVTARAETRSSSVSPWALAVRLGGGGAGLVRVIWLTQELAASQWRRRTPARPHRTDQNSEEQDMSASVWG